MSNAHEQDGLTAPPSDGLREAASRSASGSAHPFDTALPPEKTLTAREREIMALLSRGLLSREIAAELGIGTVTVKNHLYRIYEKLGVRTRTEAALKWLGR